MPESLFFPMTREELASLKGKCQEIWAEAKDLPNEKDLKDAVLDMLEILQGVETR